MFKGQDIMCVTLSDWDGPKRSRHHMMSILAKDNRVLFIERPVDLLRFFKDRQERRRLKKCFSGIRKIKDNLYAYAPPPILPGGTWVPWINAINQSILIFALRLVQIRMRMKRPLLWIFSFTGGKLIGKLNENLSLYYCNDPFPQQADSLRKKKGIERIEKQLLEKVDFVFVPSETLAEEKKKHNSRTYVLLHGVSNDFLELCKKKVTKIPDDIKKVRKPRVGYVGVLNRGLDYSLLLTVAEARPDWNLVLIGPIPKIEVDQGLLSRINKVILAENVFYLGNKQTSELPFYIKELDVCLLPYEDNAYRRFTSIPLKYFDYLAAGKPVVSNYKFSGLLDYEKDFIRIAENQQSFIGLIEESLNGDPERSVMRRQQLAQVNTWESRLEELSTYLNRYLMGEKSA